MEWPQLASTGSLGVHMPSQQPGQRLEHEQNKTSFQENDKSAKVAAQQIENMMKGLANEDEAETDTTSQQAAEQPADVTGGAEEVPAGYEQQQHRAQQTWNCDAPVYDGTASLAADPNHFAEAAFGTPETNGCNPISTAPQETQTFTVAFTVQGSGTICVNAASGQDAIEQLQYSTALEGGLAGLLSYAKCATMFQVIE